MYLNTRIQILGSSAKSCYIFLILSLSMIYSFIMVYDFPLYGQVNNEEIAFTRSINTSSLEIIFESINRTTLDKRGDEAELFRIVFMDPTKNIVQRHIDFDFTIFKEDREIFRLSNMSRQPHIPIHSSKGWEIVPVVIDGFTKSEEYLFKVVVQGISFYPIEPEEAEFRVQVPEFSRHFKYAPFFYSTKE